MLRPQIFHPLLAILSAVAVAPAAAQSPPRTKGPVSAPAPALKPIESNRLTILCDPTGYRFSLRIGATAQPDEKTYPERTVVGPEELIQMLPGWGGDLEVRGMLRRYVRCGPFTFRLEGDAYNGYIQGELGAADPFIAVSMLYGPRMAYYSQAGGGVRFTECDSEERRAQGCPEGFAIRLDGRYDARSKRLVMTQTASSLTFERETTKVERTTRTLTYDADLSLWRGEQK